MFSVVSMPCSRPTTDTTNNIRVPQLYVPGVILTVDRLRTGKFLFANLELLLSFQMDVRCVHTVTLKWFIGNTSSKPAMIYFVTDTFQREKKEKNL